MGPRRDASRRYLAEEQSGTTGRITLHQDAESLIRSSDLVVFATVAGQPHVTELSWFDHNPLVLHVSLRDLSPNILLASTNIVDDVEHCLKADTSPHLAEQLSGNQLPARHLGRRDGRKGRHPGRPAGNILTLRARSPGPRGRKSVYDETLRAGELHIVEDFFHERHRYG